MGKDKKDNKAAASKNQKGGKGGKKEEAEQKSAKMKGASSINVRHILVCIATLSIFSYVFHISNSLFRYCHKIFFSWAMQKSSA